MKKTIGRIDPARITSFTIDRPDPALLAELKTIDTPTVSDALDELGYRGNVIASSTLRPVDAEAVIAGPVITLRNERLDGNQSVAERAKLAKVFQAEIEAHNITEQGDILVIQGIDGVSNMGGMSAEIALRQGGAGAIVSGGIRDLPHIKETGYPIWASETTPVTGRWTLETAEINGPITVFGCKVMPGDIVLADASGVCFIPREKLQAVIDIAGRQRDSEAGRVAAIKAGRSLTDPVVKFQHGARQE
ncbi:RraA family protein [Ensifer sp. ENS05]|uniref:RraA family protein n=1 Tax=Ensifer sp. ENS05 TaxID=2769277 RepID=UPI00177EE309|nr:RraA family protein [Ensifer sp. ENS05]MBD9597291.1 RraA family protein [Ensifer sp. ENS05]